MRLLQSSAFDPLERRRRISVAIVKRQSPLLILRWGFLVASMIYAASPTLASTTYRTECVGRLVFSLPDAAEVAAYRSAKLRAELIQGSNQQWYEFSDGTDGSQGRLDFFGSGYISHPLTDSEFSVLLGEAKNWRERARRLAGDQAERDGSSKGSRFTDISVGSSDGVAWRFDDSYRAFLRVGDSALLWKVAADASAGSVAQAVATQVIAGVKPRAIFEVPSGPGVCAPNLFIADDGATPRDIRSFYRLKEQPDVRVLLKDATAAVHEPGIRAHNNEPAPATASFWGQLLNQAKEVRPLWTPSTRSIDLAGYSGLASFVQLTRDDNTVDYGYLAIVRGIPNSKQDVPDLMLYVVQDNRYARLKGKEPIGKEEFIKMAEHIASSVKRRPAQ